MDDMLFGFVCTVSYLLIGMIVVETVLRFKILKYDPIEGSIVLGYAAFVWPVFALVLAVHVMVWAVKKMRGVRQ